MGYSVHNQVDREKYFSISTIDKKMLEKYGITTPMTEFKEIVRRTQAYTQISTGSDRVMGQRRMTNIYRYEDFIVLSSNEAST